MSTDTQDAAGQPSAFPSVDDGGATGSPRRIIVRRSVSDLLYRNLVRAVALAAFVLLFVIGLFLFLKSLPTYRHESFWTFLTTTGFNTSGPHAVFGVAAALFWTITIAIIGVIIGIPVSLATALFITEYAPRRLRRVLVTLIDLLAVVPSVIFGLWGFFVLQPSLAGFARFCSVHLGFVPLFRVTTAVYTNSAFIAGVVVGIMIVPIVSSISREIFSLTPIGEREGALALGATKAGAIRAVVWPFGKGGFVGATLLGLGRALGETIAVAIIISLTFQINPHVFQAGANSISALIAIRFGTGGALGLSALLAAGFVLFCVTLLINLAASVVVNRSRTGASA